MQKGTFFVFYWQVLSEKNRASREMPRVDFRKVIPSDICSKICELGRLGIKLAKERDDFFRIS